MSAPFRFDNTYARLPEAFFARQEPEPVPEPGWIAFNESMAESLGLDAHRLGQDDGLKIFSGNRVPDGAQPLAMAYAGHQFGHFVPRLGDGRAILLGEVIDRQDRRRDIQLKGSGPTPFSRAGDGRSALGPVLREYLVSEAMHALGIPTTRALAAVTTGQTVYRDRPLPGAILTRTAASHVRVGTFQYFAARGDNQAVRTLGRYVIDRHYPQCNQASPWLALLEAVLERQASLVARWMQTGFIHGVMNTDNMSIAGETIDYGPCAFMDRFDPATVFSSIDHQGRYAWANQAPIAQWNLARLAESLVGVMDEDGLDAPTEANRVLETFPDRFQAHWLAGMRRKLGLTTEEPGDAGMVDELLDLLHRSSADFTNAFRALADAPDDDRAGAFRAELNRPELADEWLQSWRRRLAREAVEDTRRGDAMRAASPAFIPRNHLIEQAISGAVESSDYSLFNELRQVLARPFTDQPGKDDFARPPEPHERVYQTFCGT